MSIIASSRRTWVISLIGLKEPDVCRLLNIFLKIDSDRGGYMDSFEFLMCVDGVRERRRALHAIDATRRGPGLAQTRTRSPRVTRPYPESSLAPN